MNVLKARCVISERYSVHFLDHLQQITRPIFATPCSYNNTVMRTPLRDKIQNAINKAINHDCNNNSNINCYSNYFGEGALIVGGRRRSRKKKNKKNASKKKKSPSLDSIKNKLSPASCRKSKDCDNTPLIKQGGDEGEDKENMPLFGKKKKTSQVSDKDSSKVENGGVDAGDATVEKRDDVEPTDKDATTSGGDAAGAVTEKKQGTGNATVTFKAGVNEDAKVEVKEEEVKFSSAVTTNQPGAVEKTEKSPLVNRSDTSAKDSNVKESKIRDHSPGILCCTIL